jgi:hypothetical protein
VAHSRGLPHILAKIGSVSIQVHRRRRFVACGSHADAGCRPVIINPKMFLKLKQTPLKIPPMTPLVHDLILFEHSIRLKAAPINHPHEIVVEIPGRLLNLRQSVQLGQDFTEKAIALDLARDAALKTATRSRP